MRQANGGAGALAPLEVAAVYRGHTDAVECLEARSAGDLCVSGSWDATLRIWRTGEGRDGGRVSDEGTSTVEAVKMRP